ncbi:Methyl-accepting chemotaxis protein [Pseudomonas syringae pv. atrofaciens]|uniref:Methyl-accepting chemotaxis protein n=5 Tax=Pseudomonas TaxID=286 RepID=A0A3M4YJA3_9PSED|nr:Methyl-accepting chemotaxis protein [Pseudomonas syringae pv. atrofaciens]KPZ03322.1 Methyl-accepting chemotaxis protein [Pseudomonas syringae pv. aptata]RMO45603.1 Methyl-accepting chemotaxis protein [Pseudomonas syringae]RMR88794.1 Methyl-accepting chemotaxis protein [Pseudomonas coronafaciens pv. striafaciens]RMO66732.1 Histidine kinase, HAMP region: chemotaxis sensory transducer [Pseudomonas syringae pv. aptata]
MHYPSSSDREIKEGYTTMNLLRGTMLSTRLISAFVVCAVVTLGVGLVGYTGITGLKNSVDGIVNNNLVSVYNTSNARSNAIAHYRDLHRALLYKFAKADQAKYDETLKSLADNQKEVEQLFNAYRQTPLEDDERAAGDQFEKDWPAYINASSRVIELAAKGDLESANKIFAQEVDPAYKKTNDELKIMVASNKRQSDDVAIEAAKTSSVAYGSLGIGVVIAFVAAIILGLLVTRSITRPLLGALRTAKQVADGDLSQQIDVTGNDEISTLQSALSTMQVNLRNTVKEIANAADQLASASEELNAVTEESSKALIRQNDEIQQAATAVNEMTAAVEEVARNASGASESSEETSRSAIEGRDQVKNAVGSVNTMAEQISQSTEKVTVLATRVNEITGVLAVIQSIAQQTNLLALNAAIEAARAGEQGRGFAVVADEVRALAHRTQASTADIEAMMAQIRAGADEAVISMNNSRSLAGETRDQAVQAGHALDRITEGVSMINEKNLVIASAAEEQAHVAREVDRNLVNIQDISTQTATGAHQTNASSAELSRLAASFGVLVNKFKT